VKKRAGRTFFYGPGDGVKQRGGERRRVRGRGKREEGQKMGHHLVKSLVTSHRAKHMTQKASARLDLELLGWEREKNGEGELRPRRKGPDKKSLKKGSLRKPSAEHLPHRCGYILSQGEKTKENRTKMRGGGKVNC